MSSKNKIRELAVRPGKMKLYFLKSLPMAFLAGLKILEINKEAAAVSVPYKYLNKNPFRSVYFAVLSMAAELSSGILALAAINDFSRPVSMLVLDMKALFLKKARTKIIFRCEDGKKISEAISKSIETGDGQTVEVFTSGTDEAGEIVAEFSFTWTFKPKD